MSTIDNTGFAWKRPSGPPRVWKRFEFDGKTGSEGRNEQILRFSIEEIPSERYEEVVDLMVNYYLADEPLSSCLRIKEDPDAVEDHRRIWRLYLRQGISVGVFLDDPNVGKREIVGVNVLLVRTYEDKLSCNELKFKSVRVTKIKEFIKGVRAGSNGLDRYNVNRCLFEFGLLVIPRFRGYSLGGHLLGVRNVIGRKYKIRVTETVFTGPASQILALRNGFEVLVEKRYSDVYDNEDRLLFPNINADNIQIMGKRIPKRTTLAEAFYACVLLLIPLYGFIQLSSFLHDFIDNRQSLARLRLELLQERRNCQVPSIRTGKRPEVKQNK